MYSLSQSEEEQLAAATKSAQDFAFTGRNLPEDSRYGAAVLTDKGNIYLSGQYFSDTLSLTLHAEHAALVHAAAHGEYKIIAIAIAANQTALTHNAGKIVYPCHMCKQLLWETHLRSGLEMTVLIVDGGKIVEKLNLNDIINYPWPQNNGRAK
jgi:cytidine deaminase